MGHALAQGAPLPDPPPGHIESRVLSAPERAYTPGGGRRVAVTLSSAETPPLAVITFNSMSADFTLPARAELDRLAKSLGSRGQITLNAFAYASDPADARMVALARALAVRSYLIDRGVKMRIEIGAHGTATGDAPGERVEIVAPDG
jgi:outer membrane protein OmpA-like peptidoglycan-associated protein